MEAISIFDRVNVERGILSLPPYPKNLFYIVEQPPLVIFEGEEQLPGETGTRIMEIILDVAQELGVQRIYTGAAFPLPTYHGEPSIVYGVANRPALRDYLFREYQIRVMDEGQISGLNGLLPGYAGMRGIEAACLLATMPLYAINLPNPRAYKALVLAFEKILRIAVDQTELDLTTEEMDKKMHMIETRIRETFTASEKPAEVKKEEEGIPEYVLERIERLFQEAKVSRERAYELKRELDRWGLFESFEDRFLDLFKRGEQ